MMIVIVIVATITATAVVSPLRHGQISFLMTTRSGRQRTCVREAHRLGTAATVMLLMMAMMSRPARCTWLLKQDGVRWPSVCPR